MELDYIDGTTKAYRDLSLEVLQHCHDWEQFVIDESKGYECYECKRPDLARRLIIQLFTEKGPKIASWAVDYDFTKAKIRGPFWLKGGRVELEQGVMLILPLEPPAPIEEVDGQRFDAEGEATQPMVKYRALKWKDMEHPARWQAYTPLLIPQNGALVLERGDIKFLVLEVPKKVHGAKTQEEPQ